MYNVLFDISAVIQLILIALIIYKNITGNILFEILIGMIIYFSGNTLSGMLGYYVGGMQVNRWLCLGSQLPLIIVYLMIFLKSKKIISKVNFSNESKVQEFIWILFFGVLFVLLLCSTSFSFMPVWGNVDEAVHIEVSAEFRNILDGGTNPFYRMLGDIQIGLNRYSYLWAYHYNCAVVSKVLHIDVLHINHIIRCLSLALFISVPILWLRTSNKKAILIIITYMFFAVFFAANWYVFLQSGYTAHIFSLAVSNIIVAYYVKLGEEKDTILIKFFLPILTLFCAVSYLLTGMVLLVCVLMYMLYKRNIRGIITQLICCIFIVPLPPIWNQLMYFLGGEGNADEALTAASVLTDKPSFFLVFLIIVEAGIMLHKFKTPNAEWMLYVTCWFITFISVYFMGNNTGYVMYKILISIFPLLIFWICYIGIEVAFCIKNKYLKTSIGIPLVMCCMGLLFLMNIASFSTASIKKILIAEPQISSDEYACLKAVSDFDAASYEGIEYIGMNGPTVRIGYVFLRKIPFSWVDPGTGWSFASNFYSENILDGLKERVLTTGKTPRSIYAIINEEKAINLEAWSSYSSVLSENTEVFRSGSCSVRRISFKSLKIENLSYQDMLEGTDFIEGNILNYGECILVSELDEQKTYNFSFDKEMTIGLIDVKGRSIHDSEFILRLLYDGEVVWECNLSGFERRKIMQLDVPIICDSCEISVVGKKFSDSIILKEVSFYEVEY